MTLFSKLVGVIKRHRKIFIGVTSSILAVAMIFGGYQLAIEPLGQTNHAKVLTIGENQVTLKIGMVGATAATDYTCDGVADDVQFQTALNLLPANGGKLEVLGGNYNFTATVSRALNNVTIEGVGKGTYFAFNGVSAIFSAGTQSNWVFSNFSTDAGGITVSSATNWLFDNIYVGSIYYGSSGASSVMSSADYIVGVNTVADDVPGSSGYWVKNGKTGQLVELAVGDAALSLNYAMGSNRLVYITSGHFDTTTCWVANSSNLTVIGAGSGATVIHYTGADNGFRNYTAGAEDTEFVNQHFEKFSLQYTKSLPASIMFMLGKTNGVTFQNINFSGDGRILIGMSAGALHATPTRLTKQAKFIDCVFDATNMTEVASDVLDLFGTDLTVDRGVFIGPSAGLSYAAITVFSNNWIGITSNSQIISPTISGFAVGILIEGADNTTIVNPKINNCTFGIRGELGYDAYNLEGTIRFNYGVTIINPQITNSVADAMRWQSTSDVTIIGGRINNSGANGIYAYIESQYGETPTANLTNYTIEGTKISNTLGGAAFYYLTKITNLTIENFTLQNLQIWNDSVNFTAIEFDTSAVAGTSSPSNLIISNITFGSHVTTAIGTWTAGATMSLSVAKIYKNFGYVTENSGASVGTGAQQTIPHGLSFTPTKQQIGVWSDNATAAVWQSASPDATNIYVTDNTGGSAWHWATVGN